MKKLLFFILSILIIISFSYFKKNQIHVMNNISFTGDNNISIQDHSGVLSKNFPDSSDNDDYSIDSIIGNEDESLDSGQRDNNFTITSESIPLCEEIQLNSDTPIISIEEVLQNCDNQIGFSYYNDIGIGGLESIVMIYKNMFTRGFNDFGEESICYSNKTDFNVLLNDESGGFVNFLNKYKLNEKGLILTARDKLGIPYQYYCSVETLCNNLNGETWGEYNGHYFVYGFRSYENTLTPILVIDDKLYNVGNVELLENSTLLKNGIWNVVGFSGDKLILNRYHDNKYLDKYDYLYSNYFNNNIKNGTIISEFTLTTCEFKL